MIKLILSVILFVLIGTHLTVGPIYSPSSISGPSPSPGSLDNLKNQSGLSSGSSSGSTDFDTYINSNPTHLGDNKLSDNGAEFVGTEVTLDLSPQGTTIGRIAYWNVGNNVNNRPNEVTISSDDNSSFTSPTALGTFAITQGSLTPQVFEIDSTASSMYIRMVFTTTNRGAMSLHWANLPLTMESQFPNRLRECLAV